MLANRIIRFLSTKVVTGIIVISAVLTIVSNVAVQARESNRQDASVADLAMSGLPSRFYPFPLAELRPAQPERPPHVTIAKPDTVIVTRGTWFDSPLIPIQRILADGRVERTNADSSVTRIDDGGIEVEYADGRIMRLLMVQVQPLTPPFDLTSAGVLIGLNTPPLFFWMQSTS